MMEWWNALPLAGQIFAMIAVPATVVMILQTILLFVGMGDMASGDIAAGDMDAGTDFSAGGDGADHGGDGLALFSVRGIVAFFSVGGWVGLVAVIFSIPVIGATVLSVAAGMAALFGVAWLFKNAMRLQDSGNLDLQSLVGKTAAVYLSIPPEGKGRGKITVQSGSGLVELDAMNLEPVVIPTGAQVEICALSDDDMVLVRSVGPAEQRGGISKWS